MSRLEDIRDSLYRGKSPERPIPSPEHFPPSVDSGGIERSWVEPSPVERTLLERAYLANLRVRRSAARMFFIVAGIGLTIVLAAFVGYTVFFTRSTVSFEIVGPRHLTAGEATQITLRIANHTGVKLAEGTVVIEFPQGASLADPAGESLGPLRQRIAVEEIPAGGVLQKDLRVTFFGPRDSPQRIGGSFLYRPENIQSRLNRQADFTATIVRVPVAVTVDAPSEVGTGKEFTMTIAVDTEAAVPITHMVLGIDFPADFNLTSADPPSSSSGPHRWLLPDLTAGTSTAITLHGTVRGEPEEVKPFRVRLGRYDAIANHWLSLSEAVVGVKIASPLLLVQTTIGGNREGALTAGERVEGQVLFKNSLPQSIQNVTVTLSFPEKFVELGTVRADGGFYDAIGRAITWNPASNSRLKELTPGGEDTLAFSFVLKAALPIRTFADKNFFLPLTATIDTGTPPPDYRGVVLAYRETAEFKIISRLNLTARAAFSDGPVRNTGPLPPKVGRATTYTVFLELGNGGNDVGDVTVAARLPGNVEFRNVLDGGSALEFNPASRELSWRVGRLGAGTGVLRPHLKTAFQVVLTPAANQAGDAPPLLTDILARGRDTFADTSLEARANDLTTELRGDTRSGAAEWRVVP